MPIFKYWLCGRIRCFRIRFSSILMLLLFYIYIGFWSPFIKISVEFRMEHTKQGTRLKLASSRKMSRVGEYETGMMKDSLNTGAIHKLLRTYLRLIAICCCVLMFPSVAGVSFAGVSLVGKCAYIGQAAKLLYNIDSDYADPSLYSENGTFIASWKGTTNTVADMDPHYSGKIYMDKERNIWMFHVERKDDGRYYVKFGADLERLEVDIILTVKDKLTEEQLQECSDFPTEGTSHDTTTAGSKKDYTEASVMPEQILQLLCNYSQKVMTEPYGSSNSLIIGLLKAILAIFILDKVLTNIFSETYIRDGWIAGQHWIQEKLCSEHTRPKQSSQSHEYTSVMVTIDGSELTEHQVRNWLEGHPEFFENNESLTESLVKGFLKLHPDFMKKNDEHEDYHQSKIPSLDELNITLKDTWTEVKVNQRQCVSTEMKVIASETGSSQNSGEHENHLQVTPPTIDELGIIVHGTGREDNQKQWMSSQEKVITYETCSSSSSGAIETFRNTGYSGMQSIHKDEKKAAPKGDKAQTDSLDKSGKWMKKDPNSDDDNNEPHLGNTFYPK